MAYANSLSLNKNTFTWFETGAHHLLISTITWSLKIFSKLKWIFCAHNNYYNWRKKDLVVIYRGIIFGYGIKLWYSQQKYLKIKVDFLKDSNILSLSSNRFRTFKFSYWLLALSLSLSEVLRWVFHCGCRCNMKKKS